MINVSNIKFINVYLVLPICLTVHGLNMDYLLFKVTVACLIGDPFRGQARRGLPQAIYAGESRPSHFSVLFPEAEGPAKVCYGFES